MRYWVYMNGEIPGSYGPEELAALPGFGETSMVCPSEGDESGRGWKHAGQFPDIAQALDRRRAERPPLPPEAPREFPKDVGDILEDSSTRIFQHVTDLMGELANRREERALTQSLQRQVAELKNEIQALRERTVHLQDRADLIPSYEERERRLQEQSARFRAEIQERDRLLDETDKRVQAAKDDTAKARRSEEDLSGELKRMAQVNQELYDELAKKELMLAKSFSVIRRLETTLRDIVPSSTAGISRQVPYPEMKPPPPPSEAPPEAPAAEAPAVEAAAESEETGTAPEAPAPVEPAPEPVQAEAPVEPSVPEPADIPSEPPAVPKPAVEAPASEGQPLEDLAGPVEQISPYTEDSGRPEKEPDWPEEGVLREVPPVPLKARAQELIEKVWSFFSPYKKKEDEPPS